MFSMALNVPKLTVDPKLIDKQIMTGAGLMVVNNYRERMLRGEGVKNNQIVQLKPLSEITIAATGRDIPLSNKGHMRESFRVDPGKTTENKVTMNFPKEQAWKAAIHQKGYKDIKPKGDILAIPLTYMGVEGYIYCKKVTIPPRPHVGWTQKDIDDAYRVIEMAAVKKLEGAIKTE